MPAKGSTHLDELLGARRGLCLGRLHLRLAPHLGSAAHRLQRSTDTEQHRGGGEGFREFEGVIGWTLSS
jgi:hypothetical protein